MGARTDGGALPTSPASHAGQTNKRPLCHSAEPFLEVMGENRGAELFSQLLPVPLWACGPDPSALEPSPLFPSDYSSELLKLIAALECADLRKRRPEHS